MGRARSCSPEIRALAVVKTKSPSAAPSTEGAEQSKPETTLTDEGDSGGLALKLKSVKRRREITYIGGTQSEVTPEANPVTVKAEDGSYYLIVETDGKNGTKEPIDLTCSFPIDIALFDKGGAEYSPIKGLDWIRSLAILGATTRPNRGRSSTKASFS